MQENYTNYYKEKELDKVKQKFGDSTLIKKKCNVILKYHTYGNIRGNKSDNQKN